MNINKFKQSFVGVDPNQSPHPSLIGYIRRERLIELKIQSIQGSRKNEFFDKPLHHFIFSSDNDSDGETIFCRLKNFYTTIDKMEGDGC